MSQDTPIPRGRGDESREQRSPDEPLGATSSPSERRYDPIAPRLPLGRPQDVSDLATPAPDEPTSREAAPQAAAAAVPPALAAILVPAPSVSPTPRRQDDVMSGWVPQIDVDLPAEYADLEGSATAPGRPKFDEATSAVVAAMAWPPTDEDLDAVEVIDLEAVRAATPTPVPPRPSVPGVAPFKRAASAPAPATEGAPTGLAWPPPPEDDDLISVIDISSPPATVGSTALAADRALDSRPLQRSVPRESARTTVTADAVAAPPKTWPRVVGVIVAVASAAAAGYYVTERRLEPQVSSVVEPSAVSQVAADGRGSAAAVDSGDGLQRQEPATDAVLPEQEAVAEGNAGDAVAGPDTDAAALEALADSRRLLERGDAAGALRAALPAAQQPEGLRFIAGILRGAAADTDSARTTALNRVAGGEALDSYRSATETQSAATSAWRAGQYLRALDLYRAAARGYQAVEAPVVASRPAPVGATGRSTDVPSVASREPLAVRTDAPPLPSVPTTSGLPPTVERDPRPVTNLAPPAPEARPVAAPRFDEAGVRRTIESYRSAYDRLDAAAASALVPSLDGKALARAFSTLASQRLDFESCTVDTAGASGARATCVGRAASVPKVGSSKPRVDGRRWSFVLDRQGDRWVITSAQVTQR